MYVVWRKYLSIPLARLPGTAAVIDPHYGTEKVFHVYEVEINGQIHRFAAGEFSNCVWGFYLEKNG